MVVTKWEIVQGEWILLQHSLKPPEVNITPWLQFTGGIILWLLALLLLHSSLSSLHVACWRCKDLNHTLHSSVSHTAICKEFFFHSLSLSVSVKSKSCEPSHILPLFCHHAMHLACLSLLYAPISDLHDWLPVCVRPASSQSAVKAAILLVAIYYPVVCFKKRLSKLCFVAGCWVSRHIKL